MGPDGVLYTLGLHDFAMAAPEHFSKKWKAMGSAQCYRHCDRLRNHGRGTRNVDLLHYLQTPAAFLFQCTPSDAIGPTGGDSV